MPSFLDTYPKNHNEVIVLLRECTYEKDGFDHPAHWCIARWEHGEWYNSVSLIKTEFVEDWIEMVAWVDMKNLSVIKSENWSLRAGRDELLKQRDELAKECERLNKLLSSTLPRSADDGDERGSASQDREILHVGETLVVYKGETYYKHVPAHHRHGEGAISDGPGTPGWPDTST